MYLFNHTFLKESKSYNLYLSANIPCGPSGNVNSEQRWEQCLCIIKSYCFLGINLTRLGNMAVFLLSRHLRWQFLFFFSPVYRFGKIGGIWQNLTLEMMFVNAVRWSKEMLITNSFHFPTCLPFIYFLKTCFLSLNILWNASLYDLHNCSATSIVKQKPQ